MRINHNIASLNTYRQLSMNNNASMKSLEKLSSGYRINRAGDDAAGLAISEKMRGQIRGLDQAQRNAQDAISLIQTAEGALNETHSILQRMRELAVQSANDTNVNVDRSEIQKEIDELAKEITRIANSTEFNTQKLINGAKSANNNGSIKFHVGANTKQDITLSLNAMDAKTLGVSRDIVASATGTVADTTGNEQIGSATFSGELGIGIYDGAVIDVNFTAAVAGQTAVAPGAATLAGLTFQFSAGDDLNGYTIQLGNVADGTAASASISGTVITLNGDFTDNGNGFVSAADVQNAINTALSGEGLAYTVEVTGNAEAATTGTTSAALAGGLPAIAAESARITLSNGVHTQTVAIADPSATTYTISSGNFKGLTITMKAGQTLANIHADDAITVSATSAVASAAQFGADGTLISEAVTEAGIDVSSQSSASSAITTIQDAIEMVSAERSKLGAYQNRLEHTINNLGTSSENLTAAESRIRDVDMAKEMMEFTKNSILMQAAQAMLAQANQQPQGVLQLLR